MPSAVRRRLIAAALAVACVLALSGCVVIQSEDAGQPGVIDDLQIHTVVCLSDNAGCSSGNSGGILVPPGGGDALVAYRVPTFVSLPTTIESTAGMTLALHQSASYTSELTTKAAPPAGEKWVGYESDPMPTTSGSQFELRITIGLPQGGGAPFRYRTVTGWRNTPSSPGDPVACGPDVTQVDPPIDFSNPFNDLGPHTICVDSPSPSELPDDNVVPTNNLTVANGPGGQQVAQGTSTGAIPFSIVFAGPATPRATFKVAATTTIPGGRAVPSYSDYAPPTDSTTPVGVGLDVPPTAPVGTYAVTLTVSVPNGPTRTQTATVRVVSGAPVNTGGVAIVDSPHALRRPRIAGIVAVGKTVVCTYGDWVYAPTRFTRVWTRDGRTIRGATRQHYRIQAADAGHRLGCTETAYNASGSAIASAPSLVPARSKAAKKPRRGR